MDFINKTLFGASKLENPEFKNVALEKSTKSSNINLIDKINVLKRQQLDSAKGFVNISAEEAKAANRHQTSRWTSAGMRERFLERPININKPKVERVLDYYTPPPSTHVKIKLKQAVVSKKTGRSDAIVNSPSAIRIRVDDTKDTKPIHIDIDKRRKGDAKNVDGDYPKHHTPALLDFTNSSKDKARTNFIKEVPFISPGPGQSRHKHLNTSFFNRSKHAPSRTAINKFNAKKVQNPNNRFMYSASATELEYAGEAEDIQRPPPKMVKQKQIVHRGLYCPKQRCRLYVLTAIVFTYTAWFMNLMAQREFDVRRKKD